MQKFFWNKKKKKKTYGFKIIKIIANTKPILLSLLLFLYYSSNKIYRGYRYINYPGETFSVFEVIKINIIN